MRPDELRDLLKVLPLPVPVPVPVPLTLTLTLSLTLSLTLTLTLALTLTLTLTLPLTLTLLKVLRVQRGPSLDALGRAALMGGGRLGGGGHGRHGRESESAKGDGMTRHARCRGDIAEI